MRCSPRVTSVLLAGAFAASVLAPAWARDMAVGRIHIEYVAPTDSDHQALYAQLRERRVLEQARAIFMPFRLPRDIMMRTIGCDGVANASYRIIDNKPTITLCYEYLYELWKRSPGAAMKGGLAPGDALVRQMFFAIAHEFGHLVFDVYKLPIFGREEDAADNFATYIMLQFHEDAHWLIMGAAWSHHGFIKDYRQSAEVTLPLAAFSSIHGQPEERVYNMMCIAYGSDEKLYAGLVEKGYLPESRAKDCKYEFEALSFAFRQQVVPHINMRMAGRVPVMDWLAAALPPSPPRKVPAISLHSLCGGMACGRFAQPRNHRR